MRKLMLIEPDKVDKDSTELVAKLQSIGVDVNITPCSLKETLSTETEPGLMLDTTNGNGTDDQNSMIRSKDPPILTLDRLTEVRSPGLLWLQITYDNFNLEQVLKELLPDHVAPVTGFTIMGHVAHFNLKPDALPYRHVIGQAVIDKVANIRTVIHKAANIASDFRTFELDLMAGEPDYVTSVTENQIVYHLDVSKVYWNSRLGKCILNSAIPVILVTGELIESIDWQRSCFSIALCTLIFTFF
ncbi:unnamed protein product [Echinostoma caproni]|uniref:tRNA wybutosine-synthesizing protein 2 homolog n=1 Tax=Echinostoma caproni TaxID=27848 RepID=A0A183ASI6_9TREM|nr:unnamed protein product [Echinostoma caproni]